MRRRDDGVAGMPAADGPTGFKAYTGLGAIFAVMMSLPGAAFAFLLFISLLLPLGDAVAATLGSAFFVAWVIVVGRAFVPAYLEPTGTSLITHFFRLHRVVITPWSETRLYHIRGALYAVGSVKALPISWVIVRRHADFEREVSGHLMSAKARA